VENVTTIDEEVLSFIQNNFYKDKTGKGILGEAVSGHEIMKVKEV